MSSSAHRALHASWYTDPQQFNREQDLVFRRCWQYAGHVCAIKQRGDYFAFTLHGRSLFCIRDNEDAVRAFYNVCVHRGHELVTGTGNKRTLVCPYHAWSYGLNGRLKRAPGADKVKHFDRDRICLTAVRTEVVAGFIFVNLDPNAAAIEQWYPGLSDALRDFLPQPHRLKPTYTREVVEQCNWKVSVENYSECYHCRLNHPTFSSGVVDAESYDIITKGHILQHVTKSVAPQAMSYPIDITSHPHALDYCSWFLWPSFSFQIYPGNILNTYHWQAVDYRTTRVIRQWFAIDGVESDTLYRLVEQDLRTTVAEDIRLVESVQRGLESGGYEPGPLIINPERGVMSEHSIAELNTWLQQAMDEPTLPVA